jgi:ABC-type transport system involved in multi-copper enzyme maturation permease subunit
LLGFLLGFGGAILGFAAGYGVIALLGSSTLGFVIGIGLGVLIFLLFTMVGNVIGTYTSTAYHTCLYLWARNVEVAQKTDQPMRVSAPAPLAAVLG